jgi:hypothetical protein
MAKYCTSPAPHSLLLILYLLLAATEDADLEIAKIGTMASRSSQWRCVAGSRARPAAPRLSRQQRIRQSATPQHGSAAAPLPLLGADAPAVLS